MGSVVTLPIANVLPITDPVYAYKSDNGAFAAEFASTIGVSNAVNFTTNGHTFGWKPNNVVYVDAQGNMDVIVGVNANAVAQVWNNRVSYVGTSAMTSDIFETHNNQLKHIIRMDAPPRLPANYIGTPAQVASGGTITFDSALSIYANGATQTTDFEVTGDIGFKDANGDLVYKLPMIVAEDANGQTVNGTYKVTFNTDGTISFYGMVPWAWLQTASYPVAIDPTVVVASSYSTDARPVRLSNGWIVASANNNSSYNLYFYVSKDNGQTWAQLCWYAGGSSNQWSIASSGTAVYVLLSPIGFVNNIFFSFDASTVSNTQLVASTTYPDSSQANGMGPGCSIAIDGNGYLHATWCSRNSTYPNANNLRYGKSTDGGSTWTVTQITTYNTIGEDQTYPTLEIGSNNNPHIFYSGYDGTNKYMAVNSWSGSAWNAQVRVYNGGTYDQFSPSSAIDGNGVIHCVWSGADATYPSVRNVRYSKSTDGGATWSAMAYLTTGNSYPSDNPSITVNPSNNNLYVFYGGQAASATMTNVYYLLFNGSTWGAAVQLTTNTTSAANYPQALWSEFNMNSSDAIRAIWQDSQAGAVQYYSITTNSAPNAPILSPISNFDATSTESFSWTFSDPDHGNTQSAYELQIYDVALGTTPVDTGKVASTGSTYTLNAGTLTNGKAYQWRVTTWDNSGAQGPYSAYSTFDTSAAPSVSITSPTNGSTLTNGTVTVNWSYSDPGNYAQKSYQIQLYDSTGTTKLADSGVVTDANARAYTLQYTLANNTTYQVKATVTNSQNVTSSTVTNTVSTSFVTTQQPNATTTAQNAFVRIAMTNFSATNLVRDSGFETVTTTAQVFADALTSYTGSTAAPWTTQAGSFTFSASGVTSGATASVTTAGNVNWKPMLGSNGSSDLTLSEQATFTTPSSLPAGGVFGRLYFWVDASNQYDAYITNSGGTFYFVLAKSVGGAYSNLQTVVQTISASTTYTITLSLDRTGVLVAKLYSGAGTGGTLLQTLTATDTSITGGFLVGVGGDTGVVITNASVTAPFADGWTLDSNGSASGPEIALTTSALTGKYAASFSWESNSGRMFQTRTVSQNTTYTLSAYVYVVSGTGVQIDVPVISGAVASTASVGNWERISTTFNSGANTSLEFDIRPIGGLNATTTSTVYIDDIQLETGSMTPYVENDSTTSSQSAPAVAYNTVSRRITGTSMWSVIATNVSYSSYYDDYAVGNGVSYDYMVTAYGNNGTSASSAVVTGSVTYQGDWLYDPTTGQQFQFLFNRKPYDMDTLEERKEFQTFGNKVMVRRGPLNSRKGTLESLMVQYGTSQSPIQQLQAFETNMANHPAYYLKTAAGEVLKVDVHTPKRKMPVEYLNVQAIGIQVQWTEVS